MKSVFVDTSAVYAILVSSDARHEQARRSFERLAATTTRLLTTSYVLVETAALLGRRVGLDAVRRFHEDFVPLFEVVWVEAALHHAGFTYMIKKQVRGISLVDAVSFVVMRDQSVEIAFSFDRHFINDGFEGVD